MPERAADPPLAAGLPLAAGPPPPGWYHDPYWPAGLRWWDGGQWTQHARMPERPQPPLPTYAGRNERIGRLAMLTWAPVQVCYFAVFGWGLAAFLRSTGTPIESLVWLLVVSVSGILLWLPMILMIIWTHRCATTAAALRIPAEREPVWAVVAWIVPVISFWFPYQSVRDCLPPEHPARRDVLRWWVGYLVVSVGGFGLLALALAGTAPFVIGLVAVIAVTASTVRFGLRIVRAIDQAHRAALASK
jgi:hypothetical protein